MRKFVKTKKKDKTTLKHPIRDQELTFSKNEMLVQFNNNIMFKEDTLDWAFLFIPIRIGIIEIIIFIIKMVFRPILRFSATLGSAQSS